MPKSNEQINDKSPYRESISSVITNLRIYKTASEANYPPSDQLGDTKFQYPQYAMMVEEPSKPPLLFTPEHDELLFLIEELNLVSKNPNRIVVNLDDHDDVRLGEQNSTDINPANWGRHGREMNYWKGILHVSQNIKIAGITNKKLTDLLSFGLFHPTNTIQRLMNFIDEQPYIFTIDADEYAQFFTNPFQNEIETFAQMNFREFISLLINRKTPELIHFTSSPAFCSSEGALEAWNIVRQAYIDIN